MCLSLAVIKWEGLKKLKKRKMNELAKIDPKEFGLEEKQVATIEQAFAPKIAERDGIAKVYEQLITKEITKSVCSEARELRLKLVKVRTGIADIHRTQKAYFLAAGKFVDAWKNKETEPVEQMEENLTDIEKYFENLEKERTAKLAAEREAEIRKYSPVIPYDLGNMDATVYENYLFGVKVSMETKLAAEKAAEDERLRLIEVEKENARLKAIEYEKIRKENARMKAEAEAKEKALAAERARVESERKAEAEKQAVILEKEREQARKEAEKAAAERAKLQAELKAKQDAEIAELKAKEQAELAAKMEAERLSKSPDKEKLLKAIEEMRIVLPACKTEEANRLVPEIAEKFAGFKNWAKIQVEKL
jgi:hypothetical protein